MRVVIKIIAVVIGVCFFHIVHTYHLPARPGSDTVLFDRIVLKVVFVVISGDEKRNKFVELSQSSRFPT